MSTKKTAEKKQTTHKISFIDEFRKKLEKKAKQSKGWEIALNIVWVFMMLVWVAAVLVAAVLLWPDKRPLSSPEQPTLISQTSQTTEHRNRFHLHMRLK